MSILAARLLRVKDFRALTASVVLNSAGMMGETVVLGWLTLELTNSPLMVGVAMGMRAAPLFFVGAPAGVLADRLPRHRVLLMTGAGQGLTAAALGTLALLGWAGLGSVLFLTFAAGMIRGLEQAARQSYTHDVAGAAQLMSGLALLGVAMRVGWIIGSLGAGAVIAHLGSGAAYLGVAAANLAGAAALVPTPAAPVAREARPGASVWRSVVEFVLSLREDRMLVGLMILTAGAEMLGFSHQVLLPSLARDVLRVGPEGLGAMNAARSIGGILGLFALSGRRPAEGGGALLLGVLVFFGASLVALGAAPYALGVAGVVVVLTIVNSAGGLVDLLAQSLMQLSAPPHLRGRAGGAWVVAIGLAPVGQLQIGALASLFGVSIALGASGLALIALAAITAALFPRIRHA